MPNRLSGSTSPYLRSAAHQPVEWYAWGDEAFARARAEGKPILLDIGAVWCHWCHVIDRESYENPEIAQIINAHYVPIKVDRDERPEIDVRYQHAVGAITGQGGWPLTAVLTPEGKVFFGGTYFPPESAGGRPGFREILLAVATFYRTKRGQAHAYADELFATLHRLGAARASEELLAPAMVQTAVADIERQFDMQNGGFGGAPKFPHAGALELLLRWHDRTRDPRALVIVTRTLDKMGRGGVYDQLGGGFHRYSVDASWIVPHFEKMLYDNSELLRIYVHAYQATGSPFFQEIAAMRPGDQSRDVGDHDSGRIGERHDSQDRLGRRKKIVRDLWTRRGNPDEQGGLSGIGQAHQSDIGEQPKLQPEAPRCSLAAGLRFARRAARRCREVGVASPPAASLGDHDALAHRREVRDALACLVVVHGGAHRNGDHEVRSGPA